MAEKSERLLKIYSRLKRGPVTIATIKDWAKKNDINISERTFYRDLKELEHSLILDGERLVVSEGEKNRKVWKIEYSGNAEKLDYFDINSYLLFKNFLPLPVVLARRKSLEKIENLFYKNYSKSRFEEIVTVADSQIIGSHFYELEVLQNYDQTLEDAVWSIQNRREIIIQQTAFDYTSIAASQEFPVTLLPLQLIYHRGVVHLSGFAKDSGRLIILALEQIKKYRLTNEMFDQQALLLRLEEQMLRRFGITENIDDEVYDIEIEFSTLTGNFVKNQHWHPTQKFEMLSDENLLMKMRCGINRELVGFIFQWMSNAKVINPPGLVKMVADKYQEIFNMYENEEELFSNNSFRRE